MSNQNRKILLIAVIVLAVAGTSGSIHFYKQARDARNTRAEAEEAVVVLKKKVETLQAVAKPAPAANIVAESAEGLVVDQGEVIRSLEERLKAKDEQLAMLHAQLASSQAPAAAAQPQERRNWMDDIKENDPERYKEIMERRESARQAAKYEIAKKAAHFLQRNDASMTEEESKQYSRMMNLLTESLLLTEKLNADLPREERWDIARSLRENMRDLSPMLESERDREFFQIGKDMGYNDGDATAFASYMRDVVDLTSVQSIFRNSMQAMGGGWGGGWGGRGGEGGPPPNRGD